MEERRSLVEIASRVGVSKGCLCDWLKPYPLTNEELREHWRNAVLGARKSERSVKYDPARKGRTVVRFGRTFSTDEMDQITKGRVAEMAVALRLTAHGFTILKSMFDGTRVDLMVGAEEMHSMARIQVKWISLPPSAYGRPSIPLHRKQGVRSAERRTTRYTEADFDFIVGYDFLVDTAYVFSQKETAGNSKAITVTDGAAENWGKIAAFVGA